MKKIFFLNIVLLLVISGCQKEQKSEHFTIPQIIKDMGYFKMNSYWVYKNEATMKLDCSYVSKDPVFYVYPEGSHLTDHIWIDYNGFLIKSDLSPQDLIINTAWDPDDFLYNYLNTVPLGHTLTGDGIIYSFLSIDDSLKIHDNTFRNVYHTRWSYTYTPDTITFDTYLVPHVGLVKFSKKGAGFDTTMSLVRYNVYQ